MEGSPAQLLTAARRAAGLSASTLAAKARVPTSTVTRIEKGTTDPTFGTLARLLEAADFEFHPGIRRRSGALTTLASLASAADGNGDHLRVDWTRLRAFADWARRHPSDVPLTIADRPAQTGTAFDAILAGFAELLAQRAGSEPPRWTRSVAIPKETWTPPGTPAMVARARDATPEPLRSRNIVLPITTLFREAA
ncbi:MAG: helix-turn-helix transcriptional regulator [Acidimicrobiales bacterium]|nr:helix-turn-helix transcriptional regulator [Acidimicrobiales bacterium]